MIFATSRNKVRTGIDRAKKLAGLEETEGLAMKLQSTAHAPAAHHPGAPSVDLIALPKLG